MQLSDFGAKKQQIALDTSVPLVVFERPSTPISLRVAFFSGSRFDPMGKEGLAHFGEHMIVSGNQKYPTKQAIGAFVEGLGASFNATTSADKMDILFDYADASDTGHVLDLVQQFLSASLFSDQTIENERGAIRAELAGKKSDPGVYISRLWKRVAYQGSLVARDTIGSDESIGSITREDLLEYYQTKLVKNRAVVVASGGISADRLATELNTVNLFAQDSSPFSRPNEGTTRDTPKMTQLYPKSEQCHIVIGFPIVDESHPDYWPLFVLAKLLGGMRTSRMSHRLRNELGLVYSSFAWIDGWYGANRICAKTSCKSINAQQVIDELSVIFHQVSKGDISDEELEHCKQYTTKIQKLHLQTSSALVGYHTHRILHNPQADISVVNDLEKVNKVSLADIKRVANTYLQTNTWFAAICGDEKADNLIIDF